MLWVLEKEPEGGSGLGVDPAGKAAECLALDRSNTCSSCRGRGTHCGMKPQNMDSRVCSAKPSGYLLAGW
jgi:hypothetical protein